MPGRWLIANTRSAVEPFLSYAAHRGLRERVWRAFVGRGEIFEVWNPKTFAEHRAEARRRALEKGMTLRNAGGGNTGGGNTTGGGAQ